MKPVISSNIKVKDNGSYHINALSKGNLILGLPIEYSSCFELINHEGVSEIEIFTVNIL